MENEVKSEIKIELHISNNDTVYIPCIEGEITWKTSRLAAPGELKFNIVKDDVISVTEGNSVILKVNDKNVFYGYVFTKERGATDGIIKITAYDQLRYLKNKDTYSYVNKTATWLIKKVASFNRLNVGVLEDSGHVIPVRNEPVSTYVDMILNALDITLMNTNQLYCLYDDFGALTLKNLNNMKTDVLICDENTEDFNYKSSIDIQTYNKIKIVRNNEKTGTRDVYIAKDSESFNKWGVLQYCDELQDGENGEEKVKILLELYNRKTRELSLKKIEGDLSVRGGSLVIVALALGDIELNTYMLVEQCTHTFSENEHTMELEIRGGGYIG